MKLDSKTLILCLLVFITCYKQAVCADVLERVVVVIDASGSMWGQVDGRVKMDIANDALKNLLKDWPSNKELGVVAYGHRKKADCDDIEEIIPIGKHNIKNIENAVSKISPKGKTPLSASVQFAAEKLKYTEDKATVILISDGVETCNLDPCQVGISLEKQGIHFTTHVIGFDVKKIEEQKGLKCLAENTGGKFFSANSIEELNRAIIETKELTVNETLTSASQEKVNLSQGQLFSKDSVMRGTVIEVTHKLENSDDVKSELYIINADSNIQMDRKSVVGSPKSGFENTVIQAPASLGRYKLVWKYIYPHSDFVIAEKNIEIVDANIALHAPKEVAAATKFAPKFEGPDGLRGIVYMFKDSIDNAIESKTVFEKATGGYDTYDLTAPSELGTYMLEWRTEKKELLAQTKLDITSAKYSLKAPSEVAGGASFDVEIDGPEGLGGRVQLFQGNSAVPIVSQTIWKDTSTNKYKTYSFKAPRESGTYTIKWITDSNELLESTFIHVVDSNYALVVPSEVIGGAEFEIEPLGPDGLSGFIEMWDAHSKIKYDRKSVWKDKASGKYKIYSIKAPKAPGIYQILWLTHKDEPLAKTSIKVNPGIYSIKLIESLVGQKEFNVELNGSEGLSGHVEIFKDGSDKSIARNSVWTDPKTRKYKIYSLKTPAIAGKYIVEWRTSRDEVLARTYLEVK